MRHNIRITTSSLPLHPTSSHLRNLQLRFQQLNIAQRLQPRLIRRATLCFRALAFGTPVSGAVEVAVGDAKGVFAAAFGDVAGEEGDVFCEGRWCELRVRML